MTRSMRFFVLTACIGALLIGASWSSSIGASSNSEVVLPLVEPTPASEEPASGILSDNARQVLDVPTTASGRVPGPAIKGLNAALIDTVTGQILYARNAHQRRPNASTTKIMTAILVIERGNMADVVTAGKAACNTPFTSMHLKPGECIGLVDLLTGMMVRSANDAAVVAAEYVAGSVPEFAKLMNQKAAELGCRNTHFVTPNGLYDPKHYSSAYDLCIMARYALRYPLFSEIVQTRKYILNSRTMNREDLVMFNRSKFLKDYPGADGVKSGYLKQAGYCFVGSATRNGWRLVSAVLKSDNAGRDTAALMNYGFAAFEPVDVARANQCLGAAPVDGGSSASAPVVAAEDLRVVVPRKGAKVERVFHIFPVRAPILRGQTLGTVTATVNGKEVQTVELRAAEPMGISVARKVGRLVWAGAAMVLCVAAGGKHGAAIAGSAGRAGRWIASLLRGADCGGAGSG